MIVSVYRKEFINYIEKRDHSQIKRVSKIRNYQTINNSRNSNSSQIKMSSNNEDEEEFIDTSHEDVYFGMRIIDEIIGSSPTGVGGLYLGRVHFL